MNDDYLQRVANLQNSFYMLKTAAIHKEAGQQEIEELNGCLQSLEQTAVQLIQNRQQVEVDFASDLVQILSDLQTFVDELVGAGYANVEGAVPGTVEEPEMGEPGMEGGLVPPPPGAPLAGAPQVAGVAEETALGGVGEISGSPTKPPVSAPAAPQLPITAPAKPAFDQHRIKRVANVVVDLLKRIDKIGEDEMGKRRTISEKAAQKKEAQEKLSNSWEEK